MTECPGEHYLKPYREAVRAHGPNFKATLWSSREAQQLRFDVLIDLVDMDDCVILDAGCATGDFAARLIEREVSFSRYVGIDAVAEIIEAARKRHLPRCEFRTADLVHDASMLAEVSPDHVCISGTLNTMDEDSARRLVESAFASARRGVAFNFLSNRADEPCMKRNIGPARRFDTIRWLDWSLHLTPLVVFRQDYLEGHDATILMSKS